MNQSSFSRSKLLLMAISRLGAFMAILVMIIFTVSGNASYWQAWMYFLTLLLPMIFVMIYLIVYDPELLARRMQFREKEAPQKLIIMIGSVCYIFIYLIPALDQRFAWSEVSAMLSIVADLFVFIGYAIFIWVMRINSYASRTVEVVEGQKLISTGLYSIVRHPMYFGNIVMFSATPLALGSWWGLIAVLPLIAILTYRIKNEESVLLRDLPGYAEYQNKTPYRLLPGVW